MGGIGDGARAVGGGIADGATWPAGNVADGWDGRATRATRGTRTRPPSRSTSSRAPRAPCGASASWLAGHASPRDHYERFDPEGSEEARQGFADGAEYAWDHPWETAKPVLGIHHFENGEPGKFAGEFGITALATLASGGARGRR